MTMFLVWIFTLSLICQIHCLNFTVSAIEKKGRSNDNIVFQVEKCENEGMKGIGNKDFV